MGGGRTGLRAPAQEISLVALMLAAGMVTARAQQTLDPITVLATKTIEKTIEALAMVSSVRQEQLDQLQPKRTSDMFYGLPSVWFRERADSPETAINIRGLQDFGRVAVVVDGARQNFQRSGHNANGQFFLEPETVAEVDVSRGPVSNIYGSGAIGGVVSFRTKDAQDVLRPGERIGALMNMNLGSNTGRGLGSFFGAARPNENIDLFAGGTYRSQGDYKDGNGNIVPNSGYNMSTGMGKVTVRPAEGHEIKLGALHARVRLTRPASSPARNRSTTPTSGTRPRRRAIATASPTTTSSISTATSTGTGPVRTRPRFRTARRAVWAIRSPASSETCASSRSTPRASTSTTRRASTSANSATSSPTAATTSATT